MQWNPEVIYEIFKFGLTNFKQCQILLKTAFGTSNKTACILKWITVFHFIFHSRSFVLLFLLQYILHGKAKFGICWKMLSQNPTSSFYSFSLVKLIKCCQIFQILFSKLKLIFLLLWKQIFFRKRCLIFPFQIQNSQWLFWLVS